MSTTERIALTPALGQVVTVPLCTSSIAVYASSPELINLVAKFEGGASNFEQLDLDSSGNLYTYKLSFLSSDFPKSISVFANGVELEGKISFEHERSHGKDEEFSTEIVLEETEDFKSQRLEWLNIDDWDGWAWYRPRETWIEASFTPMSKLSPKTPTHNLLLRPNNPKIDPKSVLAVFPASPPGAFVHLTAARDGEAPGIYARVRRVKNGGRITSYVGAKVNVHKGELNAIRGAIDVARKKYGYSTAPFTQDTGHSPFTGLGFCTWSSIGEDVPLTLDLMDDLVQKLVKFNVPVGTFIIDDGWQDIRYGLNGSEKTRGLWSFDTWERMNAPLSDVVSLVKKTLPTVEDVGVWMTLHGYWNSIAPTSPLAKKYEMQTFKLNRDNLQGIDWPETDFDGQQTCSISDPEKRTWCLPPPHLAYKFWKDYFTSCFDAGVSFVKVDDQAYGSLLDGVSGGEEFVALWDGMTRAASEVFGDNRVIHCMAHYERTFNGDIGMGVATQGKKIVIRNSDDFGLNRPDIHRSHIHFNIFNAMLTSQLCLIPDPDMFMTSAQWPEYHAVLRAFFEGPVLLADKPGELDLEILNKLIGKSPTGRYQIVRAPQTIRPLSRAVWERYLDGGFGPAMKGVSYFPAARSASLVLWNTRQGALQSTADIIFESDLIDALEGIKDSVESGESLDLAVWFFSSGLAKSVSLKDFGSEPSYGAELSPPVIAVSLEPQATEALTIATYHSVGDTMVACLGLIDKYAGLAAIQRTQVKGGQLSVAISFTGILGFLVKQGAEDITGKVRVTIDNISANCAVKSKGSGLSLVEVNLVDVQAVAGKEGWTVAIDI
ncbi:putative galactinol-sucrose galactosyltransferase 2 [Hyphodiscus hymeniophilus]|uniref:Galactinol-sucrose galactosyltransferase 2 n=1 Tax=Hyphodiscus hymeniophilus TaxID=353542 RepID=A0A9P7AU16_9HELO|nr:putative galactinol-sucrose galactosyltransferase 2 [Hyphodiscus hymeniophilus]